MSAPIIHSSVAFLAALNELPPALRAHLTGWYEHSPVTDRTVANLQLKVTCMADWYAANSAAVHTHLETADRATLSYSGCEVVLFADNTYQINDTTGG